MKNQDKIFRFLNKAGDLKSTIRYITLKDGRKESSAEHSWRLVLMVMIMGKGMKINTDKAMKIALVHDIAEAVTGDINYDKVASGEISKKEKQRMEEKAMKEILGPLDLKNKKEIYNLWKEYENSPTREAKFVKALDKLETLLSLAESGHKTYLGHPEFIPNYADQAVNNFPELKSMLKEIKLKIKKEFKKGKIPWKKEYNN